MIDLKKSTYTDDDRYLSWAQIWPWSQLRKLQRECFHHDRRTKESWIREQLIDLGRNKMFWCDHCEHVWL